MESHKRKIRNILLLIIILFSAVYGYFNYYIPVEGNLLVDKNSETYINDLYFSDERIYNKYLNSIEKELYRTYLNHIKNNDENFTIKIGEKYCVNNEQCYSLMVKIHYAIIYDHPEIIDYSSFIITNDGGIDINIDLEYSVNFTPLEYLGVKKIERIIDQIKKDTNNMNDLEKINYVYKWIGDNSYYDHIFTFSANNQSYYNVFINHKGVCSAFAKASQIILQNIGINSYIVAGEMDGVGHMWNIVELDGKHYFFDSTAATGENNNQRRGLIQSNFGKYTFDHQKFFPLISTEENLVK